MDDLFELRNYFYMGNFSAAITEGQTIALESEANKIERDSILARISIENKEYDAVINAIDPSSASIAMQAVRLLALFQKDPQGSADVARFTLKEWISDPVSGSNPLLLLIAANVLGHLEDWDDALRCAHRGETLEHRALLIQLLLKIDRVDVAAKELAAMKSIDEDNTLSQLASCWVGIAQGTKESVQEALYTYQELLERHGATELILNGIAVCHLSLKQYADAERVLQESIAKNPSNPDTLVNLISVAQHRNKPAELVQRYRSQLIAVSPHHDAVQDYVAAESLLDSLIAQPPVQA
mmetsp:Transcript_2955/g.5194  ORF Transcript_2955/g.5194 Transcript_2955/m.5194 type:complete len:297 (-) Transcript_2955:656-1546(-)